MTIDEFLSARLDELEAAARAATRGPWRVAPSLLGGESMVNVEGDWTETKHLSPDPPYNGAPYEWRATVIGDTEGCGACGAEDAEHIARHNPAYVLADVVAKRKILRDFIELRDDPTRLNDAAGHMCFHVMLRVVVTLTQPFDEHPDFSPEWKTP